MLKWILLKLWLFLLMINNKELYKVWKDYNKKYKSYSKANYQYILSEIKILFIESFLIIIYQLLERRIL